MSNGNLDSTEKINLCSESMHLINRCFNAAYNAWGAGIDIRLLDDQFSISLTYDYQPVYMRWLGSESYYDSLLPGIPESAPVGWVDAIIEVRTSGRPIRASRDMYDWLSWAIEANAIIYHADIRGGVKPLLKDLRPRRDND